ncbi:MAG: hypothetical protein HZA50_14920 [Planctomycetes bacterium]|nr:hypothetical protein [Planctomycetota bacterium]
MTTLRGLALVGLVLPALAIGCTKEVTIYWDNLQNSEQKVVMTYSAAPEDLNPLGPLVVPPGGDKVYQRVKFENNDLPVNVTCRIWTPAGQPDGPTKSFQITDKTKDKLYLHIPPSNPGRPFEIIGPLSDDDSAHVGRDSSGKDLPGPSGTVLH